MSTILVGKRFEANNFISLRGKFTQLELQKKIMEMSNKFKEQGSIENPYIITTTYSVEIIDGEQVLDVEVLYPIKSEIIVNEPYEFKSKIRIENALYVKLKEDISQLNNLLEQVNKYIIDNKLQPITTAYIVQSKISSNIETEVYLGLSPNLL